MNWLKEPITIRIPTWTALLFILYTAIAMYGKFHYLLPWHS